MNWLNTRKKWTGKRNNMDFVLRQEDERRKPRILYCRKGEELKMYLEPEKKTTNWIKNNMEFVLQKTFITLAWNVRFLTNCPTFCNSEQFLVNLVKLFCSWFRSRIRYVLINLTRNRGVFGLVSPQARCTVIIQTHALCRQLVGRLVPPWVPENVLEDEEEKSV